MAKKFFHNRVHNTKRNIINAIIIGVCIIGVIICFIVVSSFEGEDHRQENGNISIKSEATVEINEAFTKDIFFSKIENVDLDNIAITYSEDITKIGRYDVNIVINDKSYVSILNVVDTKIPELTLKDVTIDKGKTYSAYDFVEKCSDNSNVDCKISYYDGKDEPEDRRISWYGRRGGICRCCWQERIWCQCHQRKPLCGRQVAAGRDEHGICP